MSNVQRSLKNGDKVTLTGFGTFSASHTRRAYGKEPSNRSVHPDSGEKSSKILSGPSSQKRHLRSYPTTSLPIWSMHYRVVSMGGFSELGSSSVNPDDAQVLVTKCRLQLNRIRYLLQQKQPSQPK